MSKEFIYVISTETLDKLCVALKCQVGDLLVHVSDSPK